MSFHLASDAHIVHNKIFEDAVVKIIHGNESQLTRSERTAVSSMAILDANQRSTRNRTEKFFSYYERLQAKRRKLTENPSQYVDCKFISTTYASVERCVSAAFWILTCFRKRISPILF